jgi:hypothetical protein
VAQVPELGLVQDRRRRHASRRIDARDRGHVFTNARAHGLL